MERNKQSLGDLWDACAQEESLKERRLKGRKNIQRNTGKSSQF